MTTFNIRLFYDTVVKLNKPYCPICFRTSVRLTKAANGKCLLSLLKKSLMLENDLICVWCEALSRRALSLLFAINAAKDIQAELTFPEMRMTQYAQNKHRTLERVVESYWKTMGCTPTSILLVDSNGVQRIEANQELSESATEPISKNIPETPPGLRPLAPAPPPIGSAAAAVSRPAQPPTPPLLVPLPQLLQTKNLAKGVRISSILPDRTQMIVRDGNCPETFTLHPTLSTHDGTLVVPTLNLVVDTSGHSLIMPENRSANDPGPSGVQNNQAQVLPAIQSVSVNVQVGNVSQTSTNNSGATQNNEIKYLIIDPLNVENQSPVNQLKNSINLINNSAPKTNSGLLYALNQPVVNNPLPNLNNSLSISNPNNPLPMVKGLLCINSEGKLEKIQLTDDSNNNSNSGIDNSVMSNNNSASNTRKRGIAADEAAPKKPCQQNPYLIDLDTINDLINVKQDQEDMGQEQSSNSASNQDGGPAKQAVMKSGKIDWEDKIPIDVISFMDATDPQAGAVLGVDPTREHVPPPPPHPTHNPFGIIAEVRSEQPDFTERPLDGTIKILIEEDINIKEESSRSDSPELIIGDCVYGSAKETDRGYKQNETRAKRRGRRRKDDEIEVIDLC